MQLLAPSDKEAGDVNCFNCWHEKDPTNRNSKNGSRGNYVDDEYVTIKRLLVNVL